jgi:hypothetical protein
MIDAMTEKSRHADDSREFRNITIRFLERDMRKLIEIEQSLQKNPADEDLRLQWVTELREYSGRVSRLTVEWEERYKKIDDLGERFAIPLARVTSSSTEDTDNEF